MSFSEPECNFFGVEIPPGESKEVAPNFSLEAVETIHLTQVALGENAAKGGHTVYIETESGAKFAVGTLDKERCTQFSMDITVATDVIKLSHSGKSAVHVTGYQTVAFMALSDEDEDEDEEALFGQDDTSEEDEDERGPPRLVPMQEGKAGKKPSAHLIVDEADKHGGLSDSEQEGSEEEGSEDEEEGSEDGSEEESDSDEEGLEGESDGGDDEESSEEEEAPAQPAKRPQPAKTPQPAKKPRLEEQRKAPASAPTKLAAAKPAGKAPAGKAAAGDDAAQYAAQLRAHLQQKGPTKLASLGSAVKKPAAVPKLKAFLAQHDKTFKYDATTDTVSLAK